MTVDAQVQPERRSAVYAVERFTTRDFGVLRVRAPRGFASLSVELFTPQTSKTASSATVLLPVEDDPGLYEGRFDWSHVDWSDASDFVKPEGDADPEDLRPGDVVRLLAVVSGDGRELLAADMLKFLCVPSRALSSGEEGDDV